MKCTRCGNVAEAVSTEYVCSCGWRCDMNGNEIFKVQRLEKGNWVDIEFMQLKSRDTFRLFHGDGAQAVDGQGHKEWLAASEPYVKPDGMRTIKIFST
jgi:hypothetical protein